MQVPRSLWLCLSTFLVGACVDDPAELGDTEQEIRGGVQIDTAETKAVVGFSFNCSGTFIHPSYVLTAAHCLPTCSASQATGCVQGGKEAILGGFWLGIDGPAGFTMTDGLTPGTGNAFTATQVFFPRWSDWGNTAPPDVAVVKVASPLRTTPVIPVVASAYLPSPASIDTQWRNAAVQIAGFSAGTFMTRARRIAGVNITGSNMENRWFEVHSNTAQLCVGDSGGPSLWRDLGGRLTVNGVNSRATDCATNDFRSWEAFIPRTMLERIAAADAGCAGRAWDACVARLSPAAPPVAPGSPAVDADTIGINVRWTDAYPPGTWQVRLDRSPPFPTGPRSFNTIASGRKTFVDAFSSGTRLDTVYTYTLCADNTLDESACTSVTFTPPTAIAPTDVMASAPSSQSLFLEFKTVDNGQMQPDVRIYRNGVSGFRTRPLAPLVYFSDTDNVYAYTNYTYRVCTVSRVGIEACTTARTDTYDGLPQCASGYQWCNGACRRLWQCPHPQ